ncbi:transporter [Trichosporon asahii var. asahii CBS 2479]|uniref:Transporter n=1 Tax=Trichosporon asahii var. asahii (strain ATCC 90039 / CBS 2479 / JCM 2466 / KCTC 7840 / NBRC 103889/ NCYC 2677 / UAMH 7654) TaxID=1186058 RepID=J6F086_TRIAS|nr:transporter [Trichosporon asahii var. asahii CBS 2479]EJT50349.1 transporter [Trichosporon asahii var. asahii CBS 2479]
MTTIQPTIEYDEERTRPDDLAPPDVDAIVDSRKRWYRRLWDARSIETVTTCISICISAVQANGVYCWPTYGILGVYLCAAPLGSLTDHLGPRVGSLISALLSSAGYYLFAAILKAPWAAEWDNTYLLLTACYFSVGAATVGSYFAALTTASLSFPAHPTLSLSVPLSFMGLSSLFLSSFSNLSTFEDDNGELNVVKYLTFLGTLSLCVNLFSSVFMRILPPKQDEMDDAQGWDSDSEYEGNYGGDSLTIADLASSLHLDERAPLLIGGIEAARKDVEAEQHGRDVRWTVWKLVHNPGFWAFGMVITFCIGPSEMVIASIGNILTSLLPPDTLPVELFDALKAAPTVVTFARSAAENSALALRNKHVLILSICSTVARLATGFLADMLAPPAPAIALATDPTEDGPVANRARGFHLLRTSFNAICCVLLGLVFLWTSGFLDRESRLWVLSAGVGALYGAIFTLTPAIVSAHFGATSFGLTWGMVSYFPALGSVLFSVSSVSHDLKLTAVPVRVQLGAWQQD